MDSPEETKKIHFSISTFKKPKSMLEIEDNQNNGNKGKYRRSSSYVIPKKFVPKIRPRKTLINPPFFILDQKNEQNENEKNKEKTETKSVKEDLSNDDEDISSFSSSSDSEREEDNIFENKLNYIDEDISNDIKQKLNYKENNEEKNKNNKNNSLSSLSNIRKKLQQIKHNSLITIKECIDLNLLNLKKKFSLDNICDNERNINNVNNEYFNYSKYKSSMFFINNKYNTKKRPFLIFDVLNDAYQKTNL